MKNYKLTIGWLYPKLMNTYGDTGNIICIVKRCQWRKIEVEVKKLNEDFNKKELNDCDLLFMGGAQDRQQRIVAYDLAKKKQDLQKKINDGVPGLYICGAYQFLGKYYKEADGTIIKGLSIFDLYTQSPGESNSRLIGNIIVKPNNKIPNLVGFENHGGRTYLGKDIKPLGKVLKGFGNNGKDKTEGALYKNSIGTYLHGPVLPKNPGLADFLIKKALEKKYKSEINLSKLDNFLEEKARSVIAKRLKVRV